MSFRLILAALPFFLNQSWRIANGKLAALPKITCFLSEVVKNDSGSLGAPTTGARLKAS
jgi:hypothetical protein